MCPQCGLHMVKLVTAAELKRVVKLSSSCWVRLQSVVKLRGGGSLGLIRLGPGAGYICRGGGQL